MAIKILFVGRTWAMGGAQTILLSLIRSLPRDAVEIVVAPYDSGEEADRVFASMAAAAGACLAEPVPWRGWRSWPAAVAALSRIVDKERIDLIHSHDNMSNTLVAFSRARLARPAIATAFGWWELNAKLKALYAFERRFVLPRFDAVYTVSHQMAGKIIRAGTPKDRVEVIHTGIDSAAWAPGGHRVESRARLGIGQEALVVGAVGRISHEKGHEHLLGAMAILMSEFPDLLAFLGGTGPDMQGLREIASELGLSDRLVMPGYVASVAQALEMLDVAVLPSVLEEGFPTASMEAQAAGLPIVASDIGGTGETLVPGVTGFLCPPGNAAALAAALRPLLLDTRLRQRMGNAARRRVAEDFTLEGMLVKIEALYRSVLDSQDGQQVPFRRS
ncbi:hypothetical protein IP69_18375 [Bosea sp. AAP35]|uniref:glycosyltransferase family 4 protein n=1 Tax=Bosea sp. AAP35 TaxID=1523417 RepID=UPI0006B9D8CE|nr:glycosyltransferase family 4 protein [Bosea sp. AAP35]KPF64342.1 hypothetical protein IP69_18375 [Bosea sp. AAP35]